MTEPQLIKHIKVGSQVPVILGIPDINSLYQLQQYITTTLGKDRIQALKLKFESRQPVDSLEMGLITISSLLHKIHDAAESNSMTEMLPIADVAKSVIDVLATTSVPST